MAYSKVPMNHTAEHKLRVQLEAKLKESETENAELKKVLFYSQQFVSNANEYMRGKMDELNVEIEKEAKSDG